MQGYSVHDLYTKALALAGLGLLAGAGALVDYWPSAINLPRPVNARVSLSGQVAAASPAHPEPGPVEARRPVDAVRPRAVATRAAVVTTAAATLPTVMPALVTPEFVGMGVPLAAPAVETLPDIVDEPGAARVPAAQPAESSAPAYALVENPSGAYALVENSAAPAAPAVDQGDGLIFGNGVITVAVRKTGTSLRKTGIKTGSSIAGAIRGFGGAVRRALPVL